HGRGLLHHAVPERPDLRHVRRHDPVADLRHPLDVLERGERLHAEPEEGDAELVCDRDDLVHVLRELLVRAVDAFAGFTGKLELRSGLEGDRRFPTLEGDHVVAFEARRPTELVGEPTQYGLDASWSEVARRASRPAIDGNLLVFGADP